MEMKVQNANKRIAIWVALTILCGGGLLAMLAPDKTMQTHVMTFEGQQRKYLVYRPENIPAGRPVPLILALHGGSGTAQQMVRYSNLNHWADKHGLMIVYPEAIDKHWNDGRRSRKFQEHDRRIDDVAWIRRLLDQLAKDYAVDSKRMYVVGASNGGMMTQRLAVELSDRFAAAATIIGALPEPLKTAKPRAPISMLLMNGTDDPLVPYEGGAVSIRSLLSAQFQNRKLLDRGRVLSTDETILWWRKQNGIKANGRVETLPDRDPKDGCRVEKTVWADPQSGREVVLFKIIGGGHGLPGTRQYLSADRIGHICQDFDGMEEIVLFFLRHP